MPVRPQRAFRTQPGGFAVNDEPPETDPAPPPDTSPGTPRGAIVVTTFLTVVILVFWFGTYLFNLARS